MAKMKTEFDLSSYNSITGTITIDQREVLVQMEIGNHTGRLKGYDLERFAVNILKALKSKKLK